MNLLKILKKPIRFSKKTEDTSSAFSKFFREASSREKKRVFLNVAREASKEQREVMRAANLNVGR